MEIRKLEKEDIPFLNEVRNSSVKYLHDPRQFSLEDTYKWFSVLTDPYFIVKKNTERIGYIRTSNWTEDTVYIGMDIAKIHRGNGYATTIYNMLFKLLKEEFQIKIVLLEVLPNNKRAIHIYEKLGFQIISKSTTNIKMQKEL